MTNGQSIQEVRKLLADENIEVPIKVYLRLTLAAVTEIYDKLDETDQKVIKMWPAYRFGLWFFAIFGVSIIGLIVLLATGQASITVK
jgi:hypothetical protein